MFSETGLNIIEWESGNIMLLELSKFHPARSWKEISKCLGEQGVPEILQDYPKGPVHKDSDLHHIYRRCIE